MTKVKKLSFFSYTKSVKIDSLTNNSLFKRCFWWPCSHAFPSLHQCMVCLERMFSNAISCSRSTRKKKTQAISFVKQTTEHECVYVGGFGVDGAKVSPSHSIALSELSVRQILAALEAFCCTFSPHCFVILVAICVIFFVSCSMPHVRVDIACFITRSLVFNISYRIFFFVCGTFAFR